jgi:hypothetical protein
MDDGGIGDFGSIGDIGPIDSDLGGIIFGVLAVVLLAILIVVLLPFIVLVVEALVVLIASMFLRRPWIVTARTTEPPTETRQWKVRGPFRTRAAVREVADELRRGVEAAPEHAEVGA